jgi:hypothetical protein
MMGTTFRTAVGILLGLLGLYALMGVLQAAMLFTGARALSNFNFWASVSFLAYIASLATLLRPWRLLRRVPYPALVASAVVLLSAGLAIAYPVASEFVAADACLDSGGSYNYVRSICDFSRNHPFVGMEWRSGLRLTFSLACLAVAAALAWHGQRRIRADTLPEPIAPARRP